MNVVQELFNNSTKRQFISPPIQQLGGSVLDGRIKATVASAALPGLNLAIFSVAGICYTAGFTLAYYLPSIPIIFWILGVVGWLILILEAVVAAPLWAASHVLPEGEGFAGPAARQGYMVLLSLLIRPVLMVIGLLFAMMLMTVLGKFIGLTFAVFTEGMNASRWVSPIGNVMMLIVLGGLIIAVAQRVFGLITYLPNNVMRWIGQAAGMGQSGAGEARAQRAGAAGGAVTGAVLSQGMRPLAGRGAKAGLKKLKK